jgi:hypothetical protein
MTALENILEGLQLAQSTHSAMPPQSRQWWGWHMAGEGATDVKDRRKFRTLAA